MNRNLIGALVKAGQPEEARLQGDFTLTLKPDDPGTMIALARCWAAREKKKEALMWVQRAVAAGFRDRQALASDPDLELIRDHRDFKKLLKEMG